ncbi:hypothetical protein, partial [Gilliamella apicola]|uniref:hypothetical protein n=1 Tax=Gilliamella apicola TaxID=1196095 RepID=UPI003FA5AA61
IFVYIIEAIFVHFFGEDQHNRFNIGDSIFSRKSLNGSMAMTNVCLQIRNNCNSVRLKFMSTID